jgi:hypothetical protein
MCVEAGKMVEGAVVTYFEVLSRHSLGRAEESHANSHDLLYGIFKARIFVVKVRLT